MSNLFVPKDQDGRDLLDLKKANLSNPGDEVLVCSDWGRIFALDDLYAKPVEICKRDNFVIGFGVHDGRLYDCGATNKIYDTLSDVEIFGSDALLKSLCSHDGSLYVSDENGYIMNVFSHEVVVKRQGAVWDLVSHHGCLYDAGDYKTVYNTTDDNPIAAPRDGDILALCSHNEKLYDSGRYKDVMLTLDDMAIASFDEHGDEPTSPVIDMFSFCGGMYGVSGTGSIFNIASGELFHDYSVLRVQPVPRKFLRGLL